MKYLASILFLLVFFGSNAQIKYEYYSTSSNDYYENLWATPIYIAQSFTVGTVGTNENFDIDSIRVLIYTNDAATYFKAALFAVDANGYPTGDTLSKGTYTGTITNSSSGLWYGVTMTDYTLQASTKYVFSLRNTVKNFQWRANTANPYAGGTALQWAPSSWGNIIGDDFLFEIWGHVASSGYSPIPGRHVRIFKDGVEVIPYERLVAEGGGLEDFDITFHWDFEDDNLGEYTDAEVIADFDYNEAKPEYTYPLNNDHSVIAAENDTGPNQHFRVNLLEGTRGSANGFQIWPDIGDNTEIYMSYDIRFKDGFEWNEGGKVPGIQVAQYDMDADPIPLDNGFAGLQMWYPETQGPTLEFYFYHHDMEGDYGEIMWYDNFLISDNVWFNVTLRAVVNTVNVEGAGENDGFVEGFINGVYKIGWYNLRMRNYSTEYLDRTYFAIFFGGGAGSEALRDETIDIDNVTIWTYDELVTSVPRGLEHSNPVDVLTLPYK